jgi:hypothetical protein
LQVGASSKFKVRKDGTILQGASTIGPGYVANTILMAPNGTDAAQYSAGQVDYPSNMLVVWGDTVNSLSGTSGTLHLRRPAAGVMGIDATLNAGGTWRTTPTTPAQITGNQDNYNPGGSSYFQRWSSDASRQVTGMTFTAAQVTGQQHVIVNVGSADIVLMEQVTSTAANQFLNSTGADITLAAKQAAYVVYDGTVSRWRVFKMN